jgi:hypothetical protein
VHTAGPQIDPPHEPYVPPVGETTIALENRLRLGFWGVALVCGVLQAWNNRHGMNSDGVSYLDLANAYLSGGWKMLVNGHWSPLYPWLIAVAKRVVNPSRYWEFALLHGVNLLAFIAALAAFDVLLRAIVAENSSSIKVAPRNVPLPSWALIAIGYSIFLWSSVSLITLERESPDMVMSIFVYLAVAILLRIRQSERRFLWFVGLGVVLGLGFLAKAPMFPLAFVFVACAAFLTGNVKRAVPGAAACLAIFLLISAPLVVQLSRIKHRLTFGESGTWNYLTIINEAGPVWYMQDEGTAKGKYVHPPQKISDSPAAYAFQGPVGGTLPIWYDPSYWVEGARPRFLLKKQISVLIKGLRIYFDIIFKEQAGVFVSFGIILVFASGGGVLKNLLKCSVLWIPALAALAGYALVLVEPRYVAVFLIVLWISLFSSLRIPTGEASEAVVKAATLVLVFALGLPLALSAADDLVQSLHSRGHAQWKIAEQLREWGVHPGDKVARIGGLHRVEWAYLLRARVIAEVPRDQAPVFWSSPPQVQARVIESFRQLGASVIVAEQIPPSETFAQAPGWKRIGQSNFFAYLLPTAEKDATVVQPEISPVLLCKSHLNI